MSVSDREVVERLCLQINLIADAASLVGKEGASFEDVYEAIEACMRSNTGVAEMAAVYDSILTSALLAKNTQRIMRNKQEDVAQVYFIQRGDGMVKIGYSHNPSARLAQIKQYIRSEMRVLATMSGARELERSLHERFVSHRGEGEWFRPGKDLMDFIDRLRRDGCAA